MASILVVDDDASVREWLVSVLKKDGHRTEEAEDGEEALEACSRRGFQLVITDHNMPEVTGMELLEKLQEEQPETEVVLMTAHGSIDQAVKAMKGGAFDYLEKPLNSSAELTLTINRALEHRRLATFQESAYARAPGGFVWKDDAMKPIAEALHRVAPTGATVLLLGESGTGKEVAARSLHERSDRARGPFVAVNCAALSSTLLESELFGHEKGAYTGATARRRGKIELAEDGTFFLDEVGELTLELQAKLLRVLEAGAFERLGSERVLQAGCRWVAATNRDLSFMVEAGTFREDLYHRLAVFPIHLPPLSERPADIEVLAPKLLHDIGSRLGRPRIALTASAMTTLKGMTFSGNVRGLRNCLERAAILSPTDTIAPEILGAGPTGPRSEDGLSGTLEDLEKRAIGKALKAHDGNRRLAAEQLGIGLRTLYDKLKKYKLGS